MARMGVGLSVLATSWALVVAAVANPPPSESQPVARSALSAVASCPVGAYRSPGGDLLAITETGDTAKNGTLRYTFLDGRFGTTDKVAVRCDGETLQFTGGGANRADGDRAAPSSEPFTRVALKITPTRFESQGFELTGQLIEPVESTPPPGTTRSSHETAKPPLVVHGHGSENWGAINRRPEAFLFAARGITNFIFDKHGTGQSQGKYTANFEWLARDIVAASAEAKRLAGGPGSNGHDSNRRYGRFGLFGASQGGWVVPRAANDARAEFVAIAYGLVISPAEEDAEQVAGELRTMGYGEDVLAKAREITDATAELLHTKFKGGLEQLAAVKKKYANEPWYGKIKGEWTGEVLAADDAALREAATTPNPRDAGLIIKYDSVGELRKVVPPQLWVVAGEDREAPPVTTISRLQGLQREGKPIEIVVFPRTDHGMYEFDEAKDGTRTRTRVTDGYFRLVSDWILWEMHPPYGAAEFYKKE